MKQVNMEWMQSLLNSNTSSNSSENKTEVDWVQNGKSFKKEIRFKLVSANSKENNIFASIVGTHWNLGPNKDQRFICPETTNHLKNLNIECPICAAKRKLLAMGFTEEELSEQGKYGLVSVFNPAITSNIKVVVLDTDLQQNWDRSHISILQQKGDYLARWIVEKYIDSETPDLLQWENSNVIKFSRTKENGKWDREITFSQFNTTPDILEKLKQDNEALSLPDIWKAPSDEELLKAREIASEMTQRFIEAKNSVINSATSISSNMPF